MFLPQLLAITTFEKDLTFIFDADKRESLIAVLIIPLTSAEGELKLKVSFLNWYLLISNQNISYPASKSILVLPVNVSAVFGFMAIWTPRGPILILSQIVPIGPSVKNQHIFLMSILILKGFRITSKSPPARRQSVQSTSCQRPRPSGRPRRCSASHSSPGLSGLFHY